MYAKILLIIPLTFSFLNDVCAQHNVSLDKAFKEQCEFYKKAAPETQIEIVNKLENGFNSNDKIFKVIEEVISFIIHQTNFIHTFKKLSPEQKQDAYYELHNICNLLTLYEVRKSLSTLNTYQTLELTIKINIAIAAYLQMQ